MNDLEAEVARLRAENAHLSALLERHGISCPKLAALPTPAPHAPEPAPTASSLSIEEKVALFRRLFRGRTDAYPVRWESKAGKSGYSPACANEWRAGVCEKPRIKCGECGNRLLIALTDKTLYDHLAGHHTIGVYPLLPDNTCHFLVVDFDAAQGSANVAGGGRRKPTGKIDIAVMQSLSRKGETDELVERYGQLVVDECHHLSAFSFEAILKRAKARFVLGLTATPVRRDGRHPIIFMQCGPVRYTAPRREGAPQELTVLPRFLDGPFDGPPDAGIQEVFRRLAADAGRNERIAADIVAGNQRGRRILVLTERTDQLETLASLLAGKVENLFVLHGRMGKKERKRLLEALNALPDEAPRALLATGRLIGEGFDHPPLDTLVLAMPVSWKGTLQQYAGRLHREHAAKTDVRIYDYVDTGHPALRRMWDKRQRGYRAMGYRIGEDDTPAPSLID